MNEEDDFPLEEKIVIFLTERIVLPLSSQIVLQHVAKSNHQTCQNHSEVIKILRKLNQEHLIKIKECNSETTENMQTNNSFTKKCEVPEIFITRISCKNLLEKLDEFIQSGVRDKVNNSKNCEPNEKNCISNNSTCDTTSSEIEEVVDFLKKPTAMERFVLESFKSPKGSQVLEYCKLRTRLDCEAAGNNNCDKLHFKRIVSAHTDTKMGDCSYLNTCFHSETCKYVHYEVESSAELRPSKYCKMPPLPLKGIPPNVTLPQWIQCDLRYFDMTLLGKFTIVMADPPWDIHMDLPYGTMSDDEMRALDIPILQDDGLLFLWVTGRAMELGRECLERWGYQYVDELIWVKTNQLQRIIRTGRTGHWLNHGKEHCLIGLKGDPHLNRGMDTDVIVSEVRDTSHKPDEIYGIIERLSPGTRKLELFGRPHNLRNNWLTLGNQLNGVGLVDNDLRRELEKRYPFGYSGLERQSAHTPPPTKKHRSVF